MPDLCFIDQCPRSSRLLCKCCQQEFCLPHFSEHHDLVNAQLNRSKEEVFQLEQRYQTPQIDRLLHQFRQQMKQWRIESYTKIDQYFDGKVQEFTRYADEKLHRQPQEIQRVQQDIDRYLRTEDLNREQIESLTSKINEIKQRIDQVEHAVSATIMSPLPIDPDLIQIPK